MLSFNVGARTANRLLAVPRIFPGSKRMSSTRIWDLIRTLNKNWDSSTSSDVTLRSRESKYSKLLDLMNGDAADEQMGAGPPHLELVQSFKNAPIFTAAVEKFVHSALPTDEKTSELVPKYGLIGSRCDLGSKTASKEDRLVLGNFGIPWSAFICGSRGSGKSHTLRCLLENALLANNNAGDPLSGMVMHFDNYTSRNTAQVCEAAYLCSSGIPVTVLVSPSNLLEMKRLYGNLPGLRPDDPKPKVVPLYLEEHQLDVFRILKFLGIIDGNKSPPLYMTVVREIVREMSMEGTAFTYKKFRERLADVEWFGKYRRGEQETSLNVRLQFLDNFIAASESRIMQSMGPTQSPENIWAFKPGSLTIVDLNDPIIHSEEACALFSVCLSIFVKNQQQCGRIVALDEATKVTLYTQSIYSLLRT